MSIVEVHAFSHYKLSAKQRSSVKSLKVSEGLARNDSLKAHRRLLLVAGRYACNECSMRFTSLFNLQRH